jgi:nucleoside-diphosphate-sugar epimerase
MPDSTTPIKHKKAGTQLSTTSPGSVAIVGGSGFVGSSLANYLSNSFEVTVLDRMQPPRLETRFISCDIRDKQALGRKLEGFNLVVNAAIVQVPEINEKKRLGYEVNVLGTQNLCDAVESIESLRGLLQISSWHVFGERGLRGILSEESGFRPDETDERARLYALCKIAQETVVRIVDAGSTKYYGIVRIGTALGEAMPKQTAANLFVENALHGQPLTPFKHTQYRPMLYVDIQDVCEAIAALASLILGNHFTKDRSPEKVINLMWPRPITIIDLARMVRRIVIKNTNGQRQPKIQVVDKGTPPLFSSKDKEQFKADISRALGLLKKKKLTSPEDSLKRVIQNMLNANKRVT